MNLADSNHDESMTPMRYARDWTLHALYQMDILCRETSQPEQRLELAMNVLSGLDEEHHPDESQELFMRTVVLGVTERLEEIDRMISSVSPKWKVTRMGVIDRSLLRMGIFELKLSKVNAGAEVVINEAVILAKRYGAQDSSRFVNGLLQEAVTRLDRPSPAA